MQLLQVWTSQTDEICHACRLGFCSVRAKHCDSFVCLCCKLLAAIIFGLSALLGTCAEHTSLVKVSLFNLFSLVAVVLTLCRSSAATTNVEGQVRSEQCTVCHFKYSQA
jgi:hypothetical protein